MPSKKYRTPIEPNKVYHIYNRGINFQNVFHSNQDKELFLKKLRHYLGDYCNLYAYCILNNHYHLLLRIRSKKKPVSNFSKQFGKLILSYTAYYNRKYKHSGPIFHRCFKRLTVDNEDYCKTLFWYIHFNPEKHDLTDNYSKYSYSSFDEYKNQTFRRIDKYLGLSLFKGYLEMLEFHKTMHDLTMLNKLLME